MENKIVGAIWNLSAKKHSQYVQSNLGGYGPDWLCYLAGKFKMPPTIYFSFPGLIFLKFFGYKTIDTKEYIERRHGEPFKFLFLPKLGLLGSQALLEKKVQF
jgi:hypothetical protein